MLHNRRAVIAAVVGLAAAAALALPTRALPAQESRKSQADVAARSDFAELPAADPAVKKAIPAGDLAAARKLIGKEGAFEGRVVEVFAPNSYSLVILNFDERYQDAMVAVVYSSRFSRFPALEKLKGKRVLVSGKFSEYKGRPQIEMTEPSQIKVIKPVATGE